MIWRRNPDRPEARPARLPALPLPDLRWLQPLLALLLWGGAALASGDSERQYAELLQRLHRYRDGLERSARTLSLEQALAIGLRDHPSLRQAYGAIEEADWSLLAIRREWWPSLTAGSDDPGILGWTSTWSREQVRSSSGWSENLTLQGGQAALPNLNLQWTFLDPSRASRNQAARSRIAAQLFLFQVQARDLILEIQQSYFALQEAYEREQDDRRLVRAIDALIQAGATPAGDRGRLDQLLTQRLSLLILRIHSHERVIQAAAALAQAVGLPPGQLAMPADRLELQGRWDTPLQASIDEALRLREEIQVSVSRAGAEGWSARARRRRYLPTLSLAGQLNGQSQTLTNSSLIGPFQPTTNLNQQIEAQFGLGFDWTLFDGGILAAEADGLRSRSRQALAQADLARLSITRQVQDNHAALLNSQIVVNAAADQVSVASRSLQAASDAYRRRTGDATRVVQASSALRDAYASFRGAVARHNIAIAALHRHSARWPAGVQPLLLQAFPRLVALPGARPAPP